MKKRTALILSIVILLTLVSCGRASETRQSTSGGALPSQQDSNSTVEQSSGLEVTGGIGSPEAGTEDDTSTPTQDPAATEGSSGQGDSSSELSDGGFTAGEDGMIAVNVTVGGKAFPAGFYDNESARVLIGQMPLTVSMNDYAGQEKVIALSYEFPSAATERPSTIRAGEIYLWSGNSLVLFYTTFSNSYGGYVPIGFIEDTSGLAAALGGGSVTVTFSVG